MSPKNIFNIARKSIYENYAPTFVLLIFFIYFLPYFILGKDFPVMIHDNLDSNLVCIKILLEGGQIFSPNNFPVNQIMNGLPLVSLFGSFNFDLLWFWFFGIYWGYVVNKFIMAFIGFLGMYLLLRNHFISKNSPVIIQLGIATTFALLPFSSLDLSVAGLPLLLYAFLNFRSGNNHYSNWLIIGLFPFYSSLVTSGFFFMVIILATVLYDKMKQNRLNYHVLLGLVLLGFMYVLSHMRLFFSFLIESDYVSHRYEFIPDTTGLLDAVKNSFNLFISGQYHAQSLHTFILFLVVFNLWLMWRDKKKDKKYMLLLVFILLTSIFYGFWQWKSLSPISEFIISMIPIQLQRFHWLHPMFWHILFGISLVTIYSKFRIGKKMVIACLFIQFVYIFKHHELVVNRNAPSFRKFFAEELFHEIKSFIGDSPDTYRVVSLGMHPSVSQFNGFYTLDAYLSDYSLSYKHQFRKIINKELEKDEDIRIYFDHWGSRCYAFSSELGRNFLYSKNSNVIIKHLDFNIEQFKKMGGRFIISAVEINHSNNNKYILRNEFNNINSFWKIYLYEVI